MNYRRVSDPDVALPIAVQTTVCHDHGMPPGKQAQAMGCEEIEAAAWFASADASNLTTLGVYRTSYVECEVLVTSL